MYKIKPQIAKRIKKYSKKWFAVTLLAILLVSANAQLANASVSDWISNSSNTIETSSQSFAFLNPVFAGYSLSIDSGLDGINPLIIQDNFLANYNIPDNKTVIVKEMTVPASAYSSTPDQTDDSPFITASNTHVRDGIIAANFLPFGTKVKIPEIYGDKIFVVEDRMNRRYWHKIDIWFPDRQSALNFGVKNIKIQILGS